MEEDLMWLLRHKSRRRIIMAIGEAERISATALRDKLGISTGSLYYNLRLLERLVQQDQKRNYMLTPEGQRVYRMLLEQQSSEEAIVKGAPGRLYNFLSNVFFPVSLFAPLYESLAMRITLPILSVTVLSALMTYARFVPFILHLFEKQRLMISEFFVNFIVSILIIYIYASIMTWIAAGKARTFRIMGGGQLLPKIKEWLKKNYADHVKFLLCILLSLLPLSILPAVVTVDRLFNIGMLPPPDSGSYFIIRDLLTLLSQGLTLIFVIAGISYAKHVRWQSSAVVAFTLFYFSLLINRFLGFI